LRDVHPAPQRTEGLPHGEPGLLAVITSEYDPAAPDWKVRPPSRGPLSPFPCFLIPVFGSRTVLQLLLEYRCCLLRTMAAMKRPDRRTLRSHGYWHGAPIWPSLSRPLTHSILIRGDRWQCTTTDVLRRWSVVKKTGDYRSLWQGCGIAEPACMALCEVVARANMGRKQQISGITSTTRTEHAGIRLVATTSRLKPHTTASRHCGTSLTSGHDMMPASYMSSLASEEALDVPAGLRQ
jgi:hypothetical protein